MSKEVQGQTTAREESSRDIYDIELTPEQEKSAARGLYKILDPEDTNSSIHDEVVFHQDTSQALQRPWRPGGDLGQLSGYTEFFRELSSDEANELILDAIKLEENESELIVLLSERHRYANKRKEIIDNLRKTGHPAAAFHGTLKISLEEFDAIRPEYLHAAKEIYVQDYSLHRNATKKLPEPLRHELRQKWLDKFELKRALAAEAVESAVSDVEYDEAIIDEVIDKIAETRLVKAFSDEIIAELRDDIFSKQAQPIHTLTIEELQDSDKLEHNTVAVIANLFIDDLWELGFGDSFIDLETLTPDEVSLLKDKLNRLITTVVDSKNDTELTNDLIGRLTDYARGEVRSIYNKEGRAGRHSKVIKWLNDKIRSYENEDRYTTGRLPQNETLKSLAGFIIDTVKPKLRALGISVQKLDVDSKKLSAVVDEKLNEGRLHLIRILAIDALLDVTKMRAEQRREVAKTRSLKLLNFLNEHDVGYPMLRGVKNDLVWIEACAGVRDDRIVSARMTGYLNIRNIENVIRHLEDLMITESELQKRRQQSQQ